MGRYSTDPNSSAPVPNNQNSAVLPPSNPYSQQFPQGPGPGMQQMQGPPPNWPTEFPKPIIGLDLNGTIIEDKLLNNTGNIVPLPGVLDAIRSLRLK